MWCLVASARSRFRRLCFQKLLDTSSIKLSCAAWFKPLLSPACEWVPRCVRACVWAHKTGRQGRACVQLRMCARPSACMCYEWLISCSVFMRLKERSKGRGVSGMQDVGKFKSSTASYGCYGHNAVVLHCDYDHNGARLSVSTEPRKCRKYTIQQVKSRPRLTSLFLHQCFCGSIAIQPNA